MKNYEQKLGETLGAFPKYKKEGNHGVVTEGIHKDTRFDNLGDLRNTMKETDRRADKVVNGLNSQFQHLPKDKQLTRDEFYRFPESVQKQMLKNVERQEQKQMLRESLETISPKEKEKKIKLYRAFALPYGKRDEFSDDDIWERILKGE